MAVSTVTKKAPKGALFLRGQVRTVRGVGQLPVKEVWLMEQFLYDLLVGTLTAVIAAFVIRLIDK